MKKLFVLILMLSAPAFANDIDTNEVHSTGAPAWATESLVNKAVSRIQDFMEWDIRKVNLIWYPDQAVFQRAHGFDATVLAFSKKQENTVHIGPRVTATDFESVFGHELVHIVLYQKYKDAVPSWLEEGLANYISKHGKVNYVWLSHQPYRDVRTLVHPFLNGAGITYDPQYHYQASTAAIEMIASKCSLPDLLQLSVGKKLESYLSTFCEIPDVNESFKAWIQKKAK